MDILIKKILRLLYVIFEKKGHVLFNYYFVKMYLFIFISGRLYHNFENIIIYFYHVELYFSSI